jgi:hypothetical protein
MIWCGSRLSLAAAAMRGSESREGLTRRMWNFGPRRPARTRRRANLASGTSASDAIRSDACQRLRISWLFVAHARRRVALFCKSSLFARPPRTERAGKRAAEKGTKCVGTDTLLAASGGTLEQSRCHVPQRHHPWRSPDDLASSATCTWLTACAILVLSRSSSGPFSGMNWSRTSSPPGAS